MHSKTRVLIVDDHPLVRLGLADALAMSDQIQVVGQGATGWEAVDLYRQLQPDVVLMDLLMPGMDGIEALGRIRAEFPEAKALMISVFDREEDIFRAVEAGAKGFLSKSTDLGELTAALSQVHRGGEHYSPNVASRLTERKKRSGLSHREMQVLHFVVSGLSNKEIVSQMRLSEATVKLHISNMLSKLQVTDRTQAAVTAIRRGIVHVEG